METKTGTCPLGAKCEEVRDDIMYVCPWYTKVRGNDPNTGQEVDEMRCAIAWLPMLMIENSQQQRQTGAAVESFRNEVVVQNNALHNDLLNHAEQNRLSSDKTVVGDGK